MSIVDDFRDPVAADVYRLTGQVGGRNRAWRIALRHRVFRPIYTLRWVQSTTGLSRRFASKIHDFACWSAGIDMPETVQVGGGLSIQHGWGVVINARARLGRNVTLLHGVTIGAGSKIAPDGTRDTGYPVLEDGVTVGPNAAIVGGITIGEGARILPNAVVYFDVPGHALVGGNPGRILKEGVPEDIWNKVPYSS